VDRSVLRWISLFLLTLLEALGQQSGVDILSGEKLRIEGGRVRLNVPMAAVRIVDLAK
jgi:hypothetical protein